MKIRALRLSDVGHFRDPVAIEGFGGIVDVLAGPNEIGKSTIFRAIEAAFLKKHTSTALDGVLPHTGGDPLIEVDFEAGGRSWRIRKRFGRGRARMAELFDLKTEKLEAKGGDADDRLFELIGLEGTVGGRFGLLWVGQDGAQQEMRRGPDPAERLALQGFIEAEILAVAGGAELSRVRRRVGELLDVHTTPANRQRARAHSAYAVALARSKEIAGALAAARLSEQAIAQKLDELERLRLRLLDLSSATAASRSAHALVEAEQRLADARRAQALHGDARAKISEARRAREALKVFDGHMSELAELTATAEVDGARLAELRMEVEASDARVALAATVLTERADQERRQQSHLDARAAADSAALRRAHIEEIEQRLTEARALEALLNARRLELAGNPVTAGRLAAIEREERALAMLEARLTAAMPTVTIDYIAGAPPIMTHGRALAGDTAISIDRPMLLEIAGIGTLLIEPGGGADLESDRADRAAHEQQLADLLADSGVPEPGAARHAHAARRDIERAVADASARLGVLAPNGSVALAATADNLRRALPIEAAGDLPPRGEIEAALADARQQLAAARRDAEEMTLAAGAARGRLQQLSGLVTGRSERITEIRRLLPPATLLGEERARLAMAADSHEAEAIIAERAARQLSAEAPSERDIMTLTIARTAADDAAKRRREDIAALEQAIAGLEGELEESYRAGGGVRAKELEGEQERAETDLRRIEDELGALRLLADELDAAERAQRAHFLRPVIARFEPYLSQMFPAASAEFGEKLDVATLVRNGSSEPIAGLSGGTREQIGVLVRLAFGQLLAEAGAAAPIILDDALVYSDDDRIVRLFPVLEQAGRHNQVIVLTCRSRTFEMLGGRHLCLTPWRSVQ